MEIFPHVYQIRSMIADRNLYQYLFVGENTVLLDTGMASTPRDVILPFLQELGISLDRLTLAINTHADADHHGGNATLKASASRVLLACGELDRQVIESPRRLFSSRYNQWVQEHGVGLSLNPKAEAWVRQMAGTEHRIDLTFRGGESLAIDDERRLRVLHVPGHSNGHLAFYSPEHRALFVGDAVHGYYCPSADGKSSLPPAYYGVLAYLSTLQSLEALEVEWIYSAHWPTYAGPHVAEFLDESRRFVSMAGEQVLRTLERHPEGVTLRDCIAECAPVLGKWPTDNMWLLMYPIYGHLTLLEQQGLVTAVTENDPPRWKLVA